MEYGDALILITTEVAANDWVLDTGTSFHITSHREFFKTFKSGNFGKVFLANDKCLKIVGKGDVLLKLANGNSWLLRDVKYVPQIKNNSISVGQLFSQGCNVKLESNKWKVTKGSLMIAKGNKSDTLYLVETHNEVGVIHNSNVEFSYKISKNSSHQDVKKEQLKRKVQNWEIEIENYDCEECNCDLSYKKLKSGAERVATVKSEISPMEIDEVLDDYFTIEIDEMEIDDTHQDNNIELCSAYNDQKLEILNESNFQTSFVKGNKKLNMVDTSWDLNHLNLHPISAENTGATRERQVKWDHKGQRREMALGLWEPDIAVDACVAPHAVVCGQVEVQDNSSICNGSVLRSDLNKYFVGFFSCVEEKYILHATLSSPTNFLAETLRLNAKRHQAEDGQVLQIRGERTKEDVDKNDKQSKSLVHYFWLSENDKMYDVQQCMWEQKVLMKHDRLTAVSCKLNGQGAEEYVMACEGMEKPFEKAQSRVIHLDITLVSKQHIVDEMESNYIASCRPSLNKVLFENLKVEMGTLRITTRAGYVEESFCIVPCWSVAAEIQVTSAIELEEAKVGTICMGKKKSSPEEGKEVSNRRQNDCDGASGDTGRSLETSEQIFIWLVAKGVFLSRLIPIGIEESVGDLGWIIPIHYNRLKLDQCSPVNKDGKVKRQVQINRHRSKNEMGCIGLAGGLVIHYDEYHVGGFLIVVFIAGVILKQCMKLLCKGVHPTIMSEVFHKAFENFWKILKLETAVQQPQAAPTTKIEKYMDKMLCISAGSHIPKICSLVLRLCREKYVSDVLKLVEDAVCQSDALIVMYNGEGKDSLINVCMGVDTKKVVRDFVGNMSQAIQTTVNREDD